MNELSGYISILSLCIAVASFIYARVGEREAKRNHARDPFGVAELNAIFQNSELPASLRNAARQELSRQLEGLELRARITRLTYLDEEIQDELRINQNIISDIQNEDSEKFALERLGNYAKKLSADLFFMIPFILGVIYFGAILLTANTSLSEKIILIICITLLLIFLCLFLISFIGKCYKDVKYLEAICLLTNKNFEPSSDWQRLVVFLGKIPDKSDIIMNLTKRIEF